MDIQVFPVNLWREGDRFLAKCLVTGIVSEGVTKEGALERLRQGVSLRVRYILPVLKPEGPVQSGP